MLSCMLFAGCKATDIGKEAGALGVFVATYIPIMTKLFMIAVRRREDAMLYERDINEGDKVYFDKDKLEKA